MDAVPPGWEGILSRGVQIETGRMVMALARSALVKMDGGKTEDRA